MRDLTGIDLDAALAWAAAVVGPVELVGELSGGMTATMLSLRSTFHADLVLRLMTREPWRTHGEELTTRESQVQRMLADSILPTPRSLALDARGDACGFPGT